MLLLPSLASAAPWKLKKKPPGLTFGGRVFTTVAPDLAMRGPYEDRFQWRSGVDFRVRYKFADDARFNIGAKARYQLRHGDRTEYDLSVDLGETYLHFRKGKFSARIGRFLHSWGRNTLISPLNVLNPLDYTVAFDPGGAAESRIPVLAVRLNLGLYPISLEAIWIPFFQPARVTFYGRDFAVFRPGLLEEMLPSLVPGTGAGLVDDELRRAGDRVVDELVGLDPYARDGVQSYLLPGLPEETIFSSDIGLQFGASASPVDLDIVLLYHLLDQPEVLLHEGIREPLLDGRLPTSAELTQLTNPGSQLVQARYPRSLMAGADLSIAAGGFVFTAEGAFESTRVLYTQRLEPYRSPAVRWAAGLRYNFGTVFAFVAEFGHDIIIRPQEDTFYVRSHELQAAFVGTVRLFRDRLQLTLTASYAIFPQDLYLHPQVVLELDDHVVATFGLQIFEGFRPDIEPTLHSFLSYSGGIVGWLRSNDYAYGTVEYRF